MTRYSLLLLVALVCLRSVQAQLPNAGFEVWTKSLIPQPVDWTTYGWSGCYGITPMFALDTVSHSGVYNAKLTTQYGGFAAQPYAGIMFNGEEIPLPACGSSFTGSPINYIPAYVSGFYTYELPQGGNDWGEVVVSIMRNDTLLASGSARLDTTLGATYASFYAPIVVDTAAPAVAPNKILVVFYTNSFYRYSMAPISPVPYAEMRIDDISIAQVPMSRIIPANLSVFPNPVNGSDVFVQYSIEDEAVDGGFCGTPLLPMPVLSMTASSEVRGFAEIIDINGATVLHKPLTENSGTWRIESSLLKSGAYICRVRNAQGTRVNQRRIIVQ